MEKIQNGIKVIEKSEFIQRLSKIKTATSVRGVEYTSIHVNGNKIYFKRSRDRTEYESILIDELLCLYLNEPNYNTSIARNYITGRCYSPSVAILNELK